MLRNWPRLMIGCAGKTMPRSRMLLGRGRDEADQVELDDSQPLLADDDTESMPVLADHDSEPPSMLSTRWPQICGPGTDRR